MRRRSGSLVLAALALALFAATVLGTLIGTVPVAWSDAIAAMLGQPVDNQTRIIVVDLRLPRVLLGVFVGASLGVGGAAMQALLRNPLADPYIFGVSSGAAVGSAVAIAAGFAAFGAFSFPAAAFAGAILATLLVYQVAKSSGRLPAETMLLAGLAIGSLLAAVASFIIFLDARRHVNIVFWMLGSFNQASWAQVGAVGVIALFAVAAVIWRSRALNAMLFGDEGAATLGVEVERTKMVVLFLVALLTAGAVAFAGIIGFVGVIVPHAMRLVVGPDHRRLLPASALFGGLLLVLCDLIARSVIPPTELPVGILTAFLGAPFFVYLLRRARGVGSWG